MAQTLLFSEEKPARETKPLNTLLIFVRLSGKETPAVSIICLPCAARINLFVRGALEDLGSYIVAGEFMDDPKLQAIKAKMRGLTIKQAREQELITKEEAELYYRALASKFGLEPTPEEIEALK